jgi:hypothetical protein
MKGDGIVSKTKLNAKGEFVDVSEYYLAGKRVSKKRFERKYPDKPIGQAPGGHLPGCWPIQSMALGVHPDQIPEARALAASRGVSLDFTPDGKAILKDRGHRRAVLKAHKYHDNDGGYGDG